MKWPSLYLVLLPLLTIVPLLCINRRRRVSVRLCLAPSPWALPVIGHLHHLVRDLPHRSMRDLARRHGPVMLLRLGGLPDAAATQVADARHLMDAPATCSLVGVYTLANGRPFSVKQATPRRPAPRPYLAAAEEDRAHASVTSHREARELHRASAKLGPSSISRLAGNLEPARGSAIQPELLAGLARAGPSWLVSSQSPSSSFPPRMPHARSWCPVTSTSPPAMTRLTIPQGGEGIILAPYGDKWRQIRKICTVELLSARCVRSFRPVREEEAGRLLSAVAAASSRGATVNLSKLLLVYAADSSMRRAIVGSRLKDRDTFLAILQRGPKMFAGLSLPDLYPSSRLAMLVSRMPGRMRQHRQQSDAFMHAIIREHKEKSAAAGGEEDLLDVLLRIQQEGDLQFPLTTDNIRSTVGDLFAGGSETAATTLQWTMAELVRNPRVMRKAQDEVRRVLAGQSQVTESSLSGMDYMRLVITEALRLHPPAPLLLPREARSDGCRVLGFDVPKGTMVLINAWAISRDPTQWDAAEEFVPERFECGTDGEQAVDFKGADLKYTPFGAGRRMCPGMAFGLATVELALAGLLYHFDWELPGKGELDMTEEMDVVVRLRHHLLLLPIVRVPVSVDSGSS